MQQVAFGRDNPFWEFSLRVYGTDGVETALLGLQDRTGVDINLLLLCCFAGRHGARLTDHALEALTRHADAWRAVAVDPLRALRRRLKRDVGAVSADLSADFRQQVKQLELEAERIQQTMLYGLLDTAEARNGRDADRRGVMRGNIATYMHLCGVTLSDEDRAQLETVVEASS